MVCQPRTVKDIFFAVITSLKSIWGIGMSAMPYMLNIAGPLAGVVYFAVSIVMSHVAVMFMLRTIEALQEAHGTPLEGSAIRRNIVDVDLDELSPGTSGGSDCNRDDSRAPIAETTGSATVVQWNLEEATGSLKANQFPADDTDNILIGVVDASCRNGDRPGHGDDRNARPPQRESDTAVDGTDAATKKLHLADFSQVSRAALGPVWEGVATTCILLGMYGVCIAYVSFVSATLRSVFPSALPPAVGRWVWSVFALVVALYSTTRRSFKALMICNVFGVACSTYFFLFFLIYSAVMIPDLYHRFPVGSSAVQCNSSSHSVVLPTLLPLSEDVPSSTPLSLLSDETTVSAVADGVLGGFGAYLRSSRMWCPSSAAQAISLCAFMSHASVVLSPRVVASVIDPGRLVPIASALTLSVFSAIYLLVGAFGVVVFSAPCLAGPASRITVSLMRYIGLVPSPLGQGLVISAVIAYVLQICATYAIMIYAPYSAIETLLVRKGFIRVEEGSTVCDSVAEKSRDSDGAIRARFVPHIAIISWRWCLLILSVILAASIENFAAWIGLIGASTHAITVYIVPTLAYLRAVVLPRLHEFHVMCGSATMYSAESDRPALLRSSGSPRRDLVLASVQMSFWASVLLRTPRILLQRTSLSGRQRREGLTWFVIAVLCALIMVFGLLVACVGTYTNFVRLRSRESVPCR